MPFDLKENYSIDNLIHNHNKISRWYILGEVAIIYKIMPDGPEVDLENMKQDISNILPESARLNKIEEKPVAFGLKSLEVQIILNDREGGSEDIEQSLGTIKNVQSVETIHVGLL